MALDDEQIIARLQRRDVAGLEALLREHGPTIKGWLRADFGLLKDAHLLEDAIHDAIEADRQRLASQRPRILHRLRRRRPPSPPPPLPRRT